MFLPVWDLLVILKCVFTFYSLMDMVVNISFKINWSFEDEFHNSYGFMQCAQEEKHFLFPVRVSVWGPVNERQVIRRNSTQFLLIFMYTEVHRIETQRSRFGGLYIILTKEKELGFMGWWIVGKTRKHMREQMENRGYFSKVYLCKLTLVATAPCHLPWLLSSWWGKEHLPQREIYTLL